MVHHDQTMLLHDNAASSGKIPWFLKHLIVHLELWSQLFLGKLHSLSQGRSESIVHTRKMILYIVPFYTPYSAHFLPLAFTQSSRLPLCPTIFSNFSPSPYNTFSLSTQFWNNHMPAIPQDFHVCCTPLHFVSSHVNFNTVYSDCLKVFHVLKLDHCQQANKHKFQTMTHFGSACQWTVQFYQCHYL